MKLTGSAAAPGEPGGRAHFRARATGARSREERSSESEIDDEPALFEGTVDRLIERLTQDSDQLRAGAVSIMVRTQGIPGIKKLIGEL